MKKLIYLLAPLICFSSLVSCGNNESEKTYTVTWKNWDGSIIETDNNVKDGEMPNFDGNTPIKEDDDFGSYEFIDWDKPLEPVHSNQEYIATYDLYDVSDQVTTVDISLTEEDLEEPFSFISITPLVGKTSRVDWGDGSIIDDKISHDYKYPGEYTIMVSNVKEISCFMNKNVTSVKLGSRVDKIINSNFYKCESLTSVSIPNSVTSIGVEAFSLCKSLTSIEIPNTVASIGNYTFSGCEKLTSVKLPTNLTSIPDYMFKDCESLETISIPETVTSIGRSAFQNCIKLSSINLPTNLASLSESLFENCQSLSSIAIPDSVTLIDKSAFKDCSNLTSIDLPDNLNEVDSNAFDGCSKLPLNENDENGCFYLGDYDKYHETYRDFVVLIKPSDKHEENSIVVSGLCKAIINGAFKETEWLEGITIEGGVKIIGEETFSGCTNLSSVNINNDKTNVIKKKAFYGCTNLQSIRLPDNLEFIGESAFEDCTSLSDVDMSGVETAEAKGSYNMFKNTSFSVGSSIKLKNESYKSTYSKLEYWKDYKDYMYCDEESSIH